MSDMIGKYIVYEGMMIDRYVVKKIIGETPAFWDVLGYRNYKSTWQDVDDARRRKKSAIGVHAVFSDPDEAIQYMLETNEKFKRLNDTLRDERISIRLEMKEIRK